MEIAIIGLPQSGKTTIFNAVTRGAAEIVGYSEKPNVGVAKVPDNRLSVLADMYKPRKVTSADVTYRDLPSPTDIAGGGVGIGGQYLNDLQSVDALLVVVRAFDSPSVSHVYETIDPFRDAEEMLLELNVLDISIVDRRLLKIDERLKAAKTQERDALFKEQTLLNQINKQLDEGISLRDQQLSYDDINRISGFALLSIKPVIFVMNIGENQLGQQNILESDFSSKVGGDHVRSAVICAQLDMELTQMDQEDEQELRGGLGTGEASLERMVRVSYDVVDQISFFTVGQDEVRAWEIRRGTMAQKAAGKIHSDLERGFIRAEVISFDHLVKSGGLSEARKSGFLRQEGKEYVLKDGEIMHVLFNV